MIGCITFDFILQIVYNKELDRVVGLNEVSMQISV